MENADDKLIKTLGALESLGEDISSIREAEELFSARIEQMEDAMEGLHAKSGDLKRQLDAFSSLLEKEEDNVKKIESLSQTLEKAAKTLSSLDLGRLTEQTEALNKSVKGLEEALKQLDKDDEAGKKEKKGGKAPTLKNAVKKGAKRGK